MRIADVVTHAVQPAGIPLVVAKVVTDQPGLYGWGCGTFTQRPGWGIEMDERLAARFPCDDAASLRPVPRLADGTSRPF